MQRRILSAALWLAATLTIFAGPAARAQDVIVGPMHWYYPEDADGELPTQAKPLSADYPDRLKGTDEIFYVILNQNISSQGKHLMASVGETGSNGLVRNATMMAFAERKNFRPARREQKDVDAHVWQAFIFNPASASPKKPTASARLLEVAPAFAPAPTDRNTHLPMARITVRVGTDGTANLLSFDRDRPPSEPLAQAVTDAVAQWKFSPARRDGVAVESEVRLPVVFLPVDAPEDRSDWPPEVTQQAAPNYPYSMRAAGLKGEVTVSFVVNTAGRVVEAAALTSNNPAFDAPAIAAVLQWRFKPARRRGQSVNTRMAVPIVFQLNEPGGGGDLYNVKKGDQSKLSPEWQYDQPPKLINMAFAVYPRELLERGADGTVGINFVVDRSGHAGEFAVVSSTQPGFAQAIVAMLDASLFDPARKSGNPTSIVMRMDQKFSANGRGDVPVSQATKDLLSRLKSKKPIAELKELDAMPRAKSRREPVFPRALQGKTDHGEAVVEFFIDDDGTALLPRAVSASAEEFGYAAVQAVSQWKFEPPLKGGKAVIVRAEVPINFKLR